MRVAIYFNGRHTIDWFARCNKDALLTAIAMGTLLWAGGQGNRGSILNSSKYDGHFDG
jgi:hypothetical protein